MTQCVPDWELEAQPNSSHALPLTSSAAVGIAASAAALQSRLDHEVAELTWVNGHPSMHGLGRVRDEKLAPWSKTPSSGGTLKSVVDQATGAILYPTSHDHSTEPWHTTTSIATVMDALVPCPKRHEEVPELVGRKRGREGNCSVSGSAASLGFGMDDVDVGFTTSTSPLVCSPDTENTSYGRPVTAVDELDSACQSRRSQRDGSCAGEVKRKGEVVRSSISTKRSRAAAIHNQSERKRRDRINERMKTLQKLVPNSSKTDKASMLDEVIDYLKQLQAQVQVMNRMSSIPQMMMPLTMQQLQMSMMAQMAQMAQMGMGMGMGMAGMTMNPLGRATTQPPTMPPQPLLHPSSFLPFVPPSFESNAGSAPQPTPSVLPNDPFSAYMACQQAQKPISMDGFNRMAAMYHQQTYNQPAQLNHISNPNE